MPSKKTKEEKQALSLGLPGDTPETSQGPPSSVVGKKRKHTESDDADAEEMQRKAKKKEKREKKTKKEREANGDEDGAVP